MMITTLFAAFPLTEDRSTFRFGSTIYFVPVITFLILLAGLLYFFVRRYMIKARKSNAPSTQLFIASKSLEQLRTEAYELLDLLEKNLASDPLMLEHAAVELSKICRNYIDQARLLGSSTMTLKEIHHSKYPDWVEAVIARCYEHEFENTSAPKTHLLQVLNYARQQIGIWP